MNLPDLERLEHEATRGPWEHDGGFRIWVADEVADAGDWRYVASVKHDPPRDGQGDCHRRVSDKRGADWEERGATADLIVSLRNAAPSLLLALRAAERVCACQRDMQDATVTKSMDELGIRIDALREALGAIK